MQMLEQIAENFRPELPVQQEIIERERKLCSHNSGREKWILSYVYLCEGDLEEMKEEYMQANGKKPIADYKAPQGKKGPCKRITVSVKTKQDEQITTEELEKKLKLSLYFRDCNAGVLYRRYQKDNETYAEAVPAVFSL